MATSYEVTIFLDWFTYLDRVAGYAGVDISSARAKNSRAVHYASIMDFDSAYPYAKDAVTDARDTLRANNPVLKAACDHLIGSISAEMEEARREGIAVDCFLGPYSNCLAVYNAGDYIAAVRILSSLSDEVSGYVSSARAGRPVGRITGAYDIPEGTTEILSIEYVQPEAAGWVEERYALEAVRDEIASVVRDAGGTLLEVRLRPPRILVFVRTESPLAWWVVLGIMAVVFTAVFGIFCLWLPAMEEAKEREEERKILETRNEFHARAYDDLVNGRISQDTFDAVVGAYDEGMTEIIEEWGKRQESLLGMLMWLIPVAIVLSVVGWFIPKRR